LEASVGYYSENNNRIINNDGNSGQKGRETIGNDGKLKESKSQKQIMKLKDISLLTQMNACAEDLSQKPFPEKRNTVTQYCVSYVFYESLVF
jgi:hypothetical protein